MKFAKTTQYVNNLSNYFLLYKTIFHCSVKFKHEKQKPERNVTKLESKFTPFLNIFIEAWTNKPPELNYILRDFVPTSNL